jgi:hypothetical protein
MAYRLSDREINCDTHDGDVDLYAENGKKDGAVCGELYGLRKPWVVRIGRYISLGTIAGTRPINSTQIVTR